MILADNSKVVIHGTGVQLMAETTSILKALLEKEVVDIEELNFIVRLATLSSEELQEELAKKLLGSLTDVFGKDEVGEAFRDLFKAMEDEWNDEHRG